MVDRQLAKYEAAAFAKGAKAVVDFLNNLPENVTTQMQARAVALEKGHKFFLTDDQIYRIYDSVLAEQQANDDAAKAQARAIEVRRCLWGSFDETFFSLDASPPT
jgi:phosphoenolpyruvate-protein kinase (PTS system EI component)